MTISKKQSLSPTLPDILDSVPSAGPCKRGEGRVSACVEAGKDNARRTSWGNHHFLEHGHPSTWPSPKEVRYVLFGPEASSTSTLPESSPAAFCQSRKGPWSARCISFHLNLSSVSVRCSCSSDTLGASILNQATDASTELHEIGIASR